MVHYIILLHQAKSAGLGHWAECWGPGDDLPADGVWDVCPVELPHVAAHALAVGSVVRVVVPDGVMIIQDFIELFIEIIRNLSCR